MHLVKSMSATAYESTVDKSDNKEALEELNAKFYSGKDTLGTKRCPQGYKVIAKLSQT